MCEGGYGEGAGSTCHACDGTKSRLLIAAGSLFMLVELTLLVVVVVFLVGGLDAVEGVRRSFTTRLSMGAGGRVSPPAPAAEAYGLSEKKTRRRGGGGLPSLGSASAGSASDAAPAFTVVSEAEAGAGEVRKDEPDNGRGMAAFGKPNRSPDGVSGSYNSYNGATTMSSSSANGGVGSGCCGVGGKIKRWASKLPMDKLKILVVVWQILTVFPSITGVDFPSSYARFLSWIDVVNFDLASLFAGSCILPVLDFYQRLLLTTLAPLVLALLLACTYWMAVRRARRAGTGAASAMLRKAAWSRHMAAGLLISFLVSLGRGRVGAHGCRRRKRVAGFFVVVVKQEHQVGRRAVCLLGRLPHG